MSIRLMMLTRFCANEHQRLRTQQLLLVREAQASGHASWSRISSGHPVPSIHACTQVLVRVTS